MFCPNCGQNVNKKLKYCNACGERLSKADVVDKDGLPGKMLDNLLTTIFLLVMFGMGILVGLAAVLLGNNVSYELVTIIVAIYLAAIFGISFPLVRQAVKLVDYRLKANDTDATSESASFLLAAKTTGQLEEYREPASVTDHTTKTLDHATLDRN